VIDLNRYRLVCSYRYCAPDGLHVFDKLRYERIGNDERLRRKEFRYRDAETHRLRKPSGADSLLYRLPEILLAVQRGDTIHWTEGERDTDSLVSVGIAATSHHQGAGRVTLEQARWLQHAKQIVLWMDKDVDRPEVGAYDAALRHNLLVAAGVPADHISIVRAFGKGRKDAADHLQRYDVSRAVVLDKMWVAQIASAYRTGSGRRLGYRRG
jgi:hypothetical protein